jgi:hypothetical protein
MLPKFIWKLLFEKEPASFESGYDINESIRRLSTIARRWSFLSRFPDVLVGSVTEDKVTLPRSFPSARKSYVAVFYGEFHVRNGVTILEGYFSESLYNRVFISVWFGLALMMVIAFPIIAFTSSFANSSGITRWHTRLILALFPNLLLILGVLVQRSGKQMARNDVEFICQRIRSTLQQDPSS